LASNKGYRSPKHLAALNELGPTPLHRLSFAPVWMCQGTQQEAFEFEDGELVDDSLVDDDEALAVDGVSDIP
jgi:ribonuclease HII